MEAGNALIEADRTNERLERLRGVSRPSGAIWAKANRGSNNLIGANRDDIC